MGLWRPLSNLVSIAAMPNGRIAVERRLQPFFFCIATLISTPLLATSPAPKPAHPRITVESDRFILNTDLPAERANEFLKDLDREADRLAKYWDKKLEEKIVCNVVVNFSAWPKEMIPDEARKKLEQKSAVTLTDRLTLEDKVVSIKSTVYSTDNVPNLHHEVVHAYCWQTFGRCGPDWYAEGMAEVFAWDHDQNVGVSYFPWAIKYLRQNKTPPTPSELISEKPSNRQLWQTYAYRWALCYVLKNNPRYSDRFQAYGRKLLCGEEVGFAKTFADVREPLAEDYQEFLQTIHPGYKFPKKEPAAALTTE